MVEDALAPKHAATPLPRTLYIWLAIIAMIWVLPAAFPSRAHRAGHMVASQASGGAVLTSDAFKSLMQAEAGTRSFVALQHVSPLASIPGSGRDLLTTAIKALDKVARQTAAPGPARRAIIARHLHGEQIKDATLQASLAPNLKKSGLTPPEIKGELALWRSLYPAPPAKPRIAPAALPREDKRVRAMRLGFLQPLVLGDLYRAGGNKTLASQFDDELAAASQRHLTRSGFIGAFNVIAFLAGLALLIVFLVAASTKRWEKVGRIATAPQSLAWGELLDAFAFYLAFFQGVGLVVGTLAGRFIATLSPRETLLFMGGVQIATGLASVAYLAAACKRRGVSLADVGLTTRGKSLASQIGYGALGWCASLPILIALGLINQKIFQNAPDTTPNPILPLMLAERNLTGRLLIFAMASLAAPFFEEVFFRGALFGALRQRFAWVPAALLSGVLFALLHPKADWIPIIGLGFTLATMREMRQSLVPGITAHFIQNTVTFLVISSIYGS